MSGLNQLIPISFGTLIQFFNDMLAEPFLNRK